MPQFRQVCSDGIERKPQTDVGVAVGEASDPERGRIGSRRARFRLVGVCDRDETLRPRETPAHV